MTDRPRNIIILCTDEMRGDCLGVNGLNPDIRTPHMDQLAADGVNLSRHFASFPKCVPARISLMTGRYSHTDGYRNIFQHLPADQPDVLSTLLDAGYEAAVFGKNHCWAHLLEASHTPPELEPGRRGLRIDHHTWTSPYRAIFDRRRAEHERAAKPPGSVELDRPLTPETDYRGDHDRHWSDEAYTEQAIHFLSEGRDPRRPFFLQVNIEAPHPAYAVPEPWYSMYDPNRIEPFPHDLPTGAPLSLRAQREHRTGLNPDPALLRKMQAVYYGMISRVDDQIGRIVETIRRQNLWDDSVILLWSDHGDFAGQYGLPEKWDTTFADCLTHVPCVFAGGGLPQGRTVTALTDHTDLAATMLGLVGLEPGWHVHGHDLRPLLSGAIDAVRDAVFADGGHEAPMRRRMQYDGGNGKQLTYARCPDAMARAKMIRTDRHKLIMRETGDHELYDLRDDRWELNNRYADPSLAAVRTELTERLIHWCLRTDPDRPEQERVGA